MSTPIIDEAAKVFADPTSGADEPRVHAAMTHLRAHAPVSPVNRPQVNSFFAELIPRLKSIELNGNPELTAATFVGGLKHLPIRCELR